MTRPVLAAFLILALAPDFAPAQADFGSVPVLFGADRDVRAMAVADFDGDGHLDVVLSEAKLASLWMYQDGAMVQSPWYPLTDLRFDDVLSIAAGDIDGDGDIDVVVGTTLFLKAFENTGSMLSDSKSWIASTRSITSGIALGDVDGDGDLDVVCANGHPNVPEVNTVYRNDNGVLTDTPVWTQTDPHFRSLSLALGDVNGDGLVDAVFGNKDGRNRLYLGNATTLLDGTFAWEDTDSLPTTGMALGDLNGDGILDLVTVNDTRPAAVYLGTGVSFSTTADWRSSTSIIGRMNDVTIGDVDRDGRLDIAVAMRYANEVYLNRPAGLDTVPSWHVDNSVWWGSVVRLADLDGDGDLELIGGGAYQNASAGFYDNRLAPYSAVADWETTVPKDTRDVELVDMDGDRDLDLVVSYHSHNDEVYTFDAGTYSLTWTSAHNFPTTDAMMGDMDGDGDPDLLCSTGNRTRDFALVYRNESGVLTPDSVWSVAADLSVLGAPLTVAWADFFADGYPDVVVGTGDTFDELVFHNTRGIPDRMNPEHMQGSIVREWVPLDYDNDGDLDIAAVASPLGASGIRFYANFGSAIGFVGIRWFEDSRGAWGVAKGHLDSDDLEDLVLAGSPSRMSWRRGGVWEKSPWLPDEGHYGVRTGDVDGDGDVDVVGIRSTPFESWIDVYHNDFTAGPNLSLNPVSTSLSRGNAQSIDVGDIDRDGDLDVVVGAGAGPFLDEGPRGITTVHMGRRTPAYAHDTVSPIHQLPANPVSVRDVDAREVAVNVWEVGFTLVDVESDPARVTLEYQYEGDGNWRPMVMPSPPSLLASSPTGVPHTVVWDVTEVQFRDREIAVRLQATDVQSRVGASVQHVSRYVMNVGNITPLRPQIGVLTAPASFSTVTVGDTVTTAIIIKNPGNQQLTVNAVNLPSPDMAITAAINTIPPGAQDTLWVDFMPVTGASSMGDITIESNDPLDPVFAVPVTVDARELRGTTRMLASAPEIPIDQDVTVVFTPADQVRVEMGYLFHRAKGSGAFADSIQLAPSGPNFLATIPAEALFESGLEYYIHVENSGVVGTDPIGAPGAFFSRDVAPPASVVTSPVPNSGDGFGEGLPVTVGVLLPPGSEFGRGWLYYRAGATADYDTVTMTGADAAASAVIPGDAIGNRGVEYWTEVHTSTTTLTDPPSNPSTVPHSLQVTLANVDEQQSHPGMKYRVLSFPADVQGTVEGAIADDVGGADATRWRLFAYDGTRYVEGVENFEHGRAYFFIARDVNRLDTRPATALSTDTTVPFEVRLDRGWNLVGQPFPFPVAWSDVIRDTMAVPGPPKRYTGQGNNYADATILKPFSGYWVHNDSSTVKSIWIPPIEYTGAVAPAPPAVPLAWGIDVTADGENDTRRTLRLGVSDSAKDARDGLDRLLPPLAPESPLDLYAVGAGGQWFSQDARTTSMMPGWGHVWSFDVAVAKNGRVPVTLAFDFDGVPEGGEVLLLDREVGRAHDLSDGASIEVYATGAERKTSPENTRFVLLTGDAQYIEEHRSLLPGLPTQTALHQNFPNPFNPTTVIRYELARPGRVSLRIYDVRGALVRTLVDSDKAAGRYEVGWDGVDNRGSKVASGIYFYRLVSGGGVVLTRKMVLLK